MDENYRTEPYRVLFGLSFGGLVSVYSLIKHPDFFNSYILAEPHFEYDNKSMFGLAKKFLQSYDGNRKDIFLCAGDNENFKENAQVFNDLLYSIQNQKIYWKYRHFSGEYHNSVPHLALLYGIRYIFEGWYMSADELVEGYEAIESHYDSLSVKYGFRIKPPEAVINQAGYLLLMIKNYDKAIAVFTKNVEKYPDSWNAYDSLAEAYFTKGDKSKAKKYYRKSLELNPDNANAKMMLEKMGE
jgi:tetratricopeptide (TPR) repeat protein